jgi:hypothetical protein
MWERKPQKNCGPGNKPLQVPWQQPMTELMMELTNGKDLQNYLGILSKEAIFISNLYHEQCPRIFRLEFKHL